tara:strand:- start:29 stop:460 length:432 start_codon:yes stop_codon:yes gene_type:complete
MASQLKVDTLTGVTTAGSIVVTSEGNSTTTNLQQGLMKSFFYISPAGDVTVKDSLNLSSMTDSGTGRYVGNINSNMGNDDFCQLYSGSNNSSGATDINHHIQQSTDGRNKATSRYAEFMTTNAAGNSFTEAFAADCAIFGDLA